jgi:hypothetical protein
MNQENSQIDLPHSPKKTFPGAYKECSEDIKEPSNTDITWSLQDLLEWPRMHPDKPVVCAKWNILTKFTAISLILKIFFWLKPNQAMLYCCGCATA